MTRAALAPFVAAMLVASMVLRGQSTPLAASLDRIFDDPLLSRALTAVRIDAIAEGAQPMATVLYARNRGKLVMPASNMKLHTLAVAAERLGWDYRYETRLEAAGTIAGPVLSGDLVVTGGGDPSIVSLDAEGAALFRTWADAVWDAGIRAVTGHVIADDRAFADEPLGPGWAWDYLDASYAAPSSALSYNENSVTARVWPGAASGAAARIELAPPGSGFDIRNHVTTAPTGTPPRIDVIRPLGTNGLEIRGAIAAGAAPISRVTTVPDPAMFFAEAFRLALAARGIDVRGGAQRLQNEAPGPSPSRRVIATRQSPPLSALAGYFLKVSQNFYAEMLLKTIGRAPSTPGSIAGGRRAVVETLSSWGIPADAYVIHDGSGLSRYDYTTADTVVAILEHVWADERLRGPFVAALPVAGRDGTLENRMRGTVLDGRLEAKTGSISNVRALSGFLETGDHHHVAFSIIVNNFTAPAASIDAIVERCLMEVARVNTPF